MKKLFLINLLALFVFVNTYGQASYLQQVKDFPVSISYEAVSNYFSEMSTLKETIKAKIEVYKSENDAIGKTIDPAKVAATYMNMGQTMTVADIQAMQAYNQSIVDNQAKLTALSLKFSNLKDSIDVEYKTDFDVYYKDYTDYMNKCTGEVGSGSNCDALSTALKTAATKVLMKYFFGESAKYVGYINAYRQELTATYILCATQALEYNEKSTGITFPHKEDLAYLQLAENIISTINETFDIHSSLWMFVQ